MCLLDTGNLAIAFFEEKNREKVLELYKNLTDHEYSTLKELHKRFSIILRILSCKSSVKDEFEEYCLSTYVMFVKEFPWMKLSETVHRLLAHAPEAIRINGNKGLGQLSESPLEAQHKLIRRYRTTLARLTNESDNLCDVYNRLYMQSSPMIRKLRPKKKAKKMSKELSNDDEIINSFLY